MYNDPSQVYEIMRKEICAEFDFIAKMSYAVYTLLTHTGVNECFSNPCVNGICVDMEDGFECRCDLGYNGTLCENSKYYHSIKRNKFVVLLDKWRHV